VEICTNLLQHAGIKKKLNETTPKLKSDGRETREKEILGV
jgi:hypothetical protein